MNIRRAAIAATAGVVATTFLSVAAVGAGEAPLLPISVSPGSGPAGTVVTVSGEDCVNSVGPGEVDVYLFYGESEDPIGQLTALVAEDGSWSVGVEFESTDGLGLYDITATCFLDLPESESEAIDYDWGTFDLIAGPGTTPPPTTPPADPTDPVVAPQAPPAAPVVAEPSFAG